MGGVPVARGRASLRASLQHEALLGGPVDRARVEGVGEVEGRDCIIPDDMIDTAGTMVEAANALKRLGAGDIYPVRRISTAVVEL